MRLARWGGEMVVGRWERGKKELTKATHGTFFFFLPAIRQLRIRILSPTGTHQVMAAPHPNQVAFKEGVQYLFHSWTALKLAVDGEWGGQDSVEKRDWFIDTVVDYFGQRKRGWQDV
jgi:hypothetical protein